MWDQAKKKDDAGMTLMPLRHFLMKLPVVERVHLRGLFELRLTEFVDDALLSAQESGSDAVQLELTRLRRVLTPLGYGRLLDAQRVRDTLLRLEEIDRVLLGHDRRL